MENENCQVTEAELNDPYLNLYEEILKEIDEGTLCNN